MIKQSIKDILLLTGKVSFSFKERIDDWISEAKILLLFDPWKTVLVELPKFREEFQLSKIDEAINIFCDKVFSKKNLALSFIGIEKHKLLPERMDFDDIDDDELRILIRKYKKEYFDKDFPKEFLK